MVMEPVKKILITGSTGSIGHLLMRSLELCKNYEIYTLDRDKSRSLLSGRSASHCFDWDDVYCSRLPLARIDCVVHLASARYHHSAEQVAQSLESTIKLFCMASREGVTEIINMSSQSVYGDCADSPWRESMKVTPSTLYAQSKYAAELLLGNLSETYPMLNHTSIRLSSVTGMYPRVIESDAIAKIAMKMKSNFPVTIYGGSQVIERIHIEDVINALVKLIESNSSEWNGIYNLGSGTVSPLDEIVMRLAKVAESKYAYDLSLIKKASIGEYQVHSGYVDSALFQSDFQWLPCRSWEDLI